jgi:tRNA threonylcarbamoyladenosine biosynthesis protein TsaE
LDKAISGMRDVSQVAVDRVETTSPTETEAVGARVAARLRPGDVVLVAGELGAGKTTLVRGACRELGVAVPVTSPTFTIGQRYPAPVPISHIDLFRIDRMAEEEPDLLADYLGLDKIAFIEWPPTGSSEHAALGRIACRVGIEHAGGDRRLVEIA